MTVDAQVRNSYYTIKQSEAIIRQLAMKTDNVEAKHAFTTAEQLLGFIEEDLKNQLIFIAKEETEYE